MVVCLIFKKLNNFYFFDKSSILNIIDFEILFDLEIFLYLKKFAPINRVLFDNP